MTREDNDPLEEETLKPIIDIYNSLYDSVKNYENLFGDHYFSKDVTENARKFIENNLLHLNEFTGDHKTTIDTATCLYQVPNKVTQLTQDLQSLMSYLKNDLNTYLDDFNM